MKRWKSVGILFLGATAVAADGAAQNTTIVAAPAGTRLELEAMRAAAPPTIDGRLDDSAWQVPPAATGFLQSRPSPGLPATESTEVRVLYDDAYLYVAARMFDPSPDSIVAPLVRRDQDVHSDWFSVAVDSYRDRRTAFVFAVNPRGVQRDVLFHDDTREDVGWNAVWTAAAAIDSLGWTVEIRIPLSQLRFRRSEGSQAWGINFERRLARRDEVSTWSPLRPDMDGRVSRFGDLTGLRALSPPRRLELQPYSMGRVTRAPGEPGDPFHRPGAYRGSIGADLKYGLGSAFTLTATVNPDFGQVEADPSEVNLTAFETFLPERRPFFTEGAEIFQSGWPEIFYSRRIGRAPRGSAPGSAVYSSAPEASTILGALKLTGKTAGGWSLGLLSAVTGREMARYVDATGLVQTVPVEPQTRYAVGRVSRNFRKGSSTLGATWTWTGRSLEPEGTLGFLPRAAYAGALDARHRFLDARYEVSARLIGSHVQGGEDAIGRLQRAPGRYFQRPDASHVEFDPSRTSLGGYHAFTHLAKVSGSWRWGVGGYAHSPGLELNDLGFQSAPDETRAHLQIGYHRFQPGPLFRRWSVGGWAHSEQTFGGEATDRALQLDGSFLLHSQWGGNLWVMRHFDALAPSALRGGPALARSARYMGGSSLHTDRGKAVNLRFGTFWETEDDGGSWRLNLNPALHVRPSDRFSLALQPSVAWNHNAWQYVGRREVAGEPVYLLGHLRQRTASSTTRLEYTHSPTLSLQLYAQPFLSAQRYDAFRTLTDPRAPRFADRFRTFSPLDMVEAGSAAGRAYAVDLNGDGVPDLSFRDPSFNWEQLRSNLVLRWEYGPGSTLFLVWSQGRTSSAPRGEADLRDDLGRLLREPGTNTLLIKVNYWLGL
jgi:hypothetical protein